MEKKLKILRGLSTLPSKRDKRRGLKFCFRVVLAILVIIILFAVLAAFFDLRPSSPPLPPKTGEVVRIRGDFQVGAARVDLVPSIPVSVAGYPLPRPKAHSSGPLYARALVIANGRGAIGLISAEVLLIPEALIQRVRERAKGFGIGEVLVTATHTHSSFGGYASHPLAQWAATGWYSPKLAEHLVDKMAGALSEAYKTMRPATISVGQASVLGVSRNRNHPEGVVDPTLSMVVAKDRQNQILVRLLVYGAHPTMVERKNDRLDGDWPGRVMEKLESGGGVAIVLQGAVGDVSASAPKQAKSPPDWVGERVTDQFRDAENSLAPIFEAAAVEIEVSLPAAEVGSAVPKPLHKLSSNFLDAVSQHSARLAVMDLGKTRFVFSPTEPTVAAARQLQSRLPFADALVVVGLAQGYVGYLETSENMKDGKGESRRTLWGKELLPRVEEGFVAGIRALERL